MTKWSKLTNNSSRLIMYLSLGGVGGIVQRLVGRGVEKRGTDCSAYQLVERQTCSGGGGRVGGGGGRSD